MFKSSIKESDNFSFTYQQPPTSSYSYIIGKTNDIPFVTLTLKHLTPEIACIERVHKTNTVGVVSRFYLWLFNELKLTVILSSGFRSEDAERFWEKLRGDGEIKKFKAVFNLDFLKALDETHDFGEESVILKDRSDLIWGLAKTKEDFSNHFTHNYANNDECPWEITTSS